MDIFEHNGRLWIPVGGGGIRPPRWRDIAKLAALRALGVSPVYGGRPVIAGGSSGSGGGGGGGFSSAGDLLDGTGSTIDWNPNDPTLLILGPEDFCGGVSGASFLSVYNWQESTIGGTASVQAPASTNPNLGLCRIATPSTSGQGGGLVIQGGGTFLGDLKGNTNWELIWIFRLNSNVNVRFRVGLANQANVAEPTDGMWLRFDTSAGFGDLNFNVECRNGSLSTVTDTTVAANTNFNKLRIRSTTAGTILFTLNAGSDISIATANVPNTSMTPAGILVTDAAAGKTVDYDFFSFKLRGLSR